MLEFAAIMAYIEEGVIQPNNIEFKFRNCLVFEFLFYNSFNCEHFLRAFYSFTNEPFQIFRFFKLLPPHELGLKFDLGLVGLGLGLGLVGLGLGLVGTTSASASLGCGLVTITANLY